MAAKSGVRVELYKAGVFQSYTTTDGSGNYSFTGLTVADDYSIKMILPTNDSGYTNAHKNCVILDPSGTQTGTPPTNGWPIHVNAGGNTTAAWTYTKSQN